MTLTAHLIYLTERQKRAKILCDNSMEYEFVRHDGTYTCDFWGHLLLRLTQLNNGDYRVILQDADDFELFKDFTNSDKALKTFEFYADFFKDSPPNLVNEIQRSMRNQMFIG